MLEVKQIGAGRQPIFLANHNMFMWDWHQIYTKSFQGYGLSIYKMHVEDF